VSGEDQEIRSDRRGNRAMGTGTRGLSLGKGTMESTRIVGDLIETNEPWDAET
jgi:hypothetical protein